MPEELGLSESLPGNHRLVALMDRAHLDEHFQSGADRLAYLQSLDFGKFERLLSTANGICRDRAPAEREMDGAGNIFRPNSSLERLELAYVPPAREDRALLMCEAFEAARRIDNVGRVATMLGLVINAVHPYADGNGRTSRLVYSLLARGYDGRPEDQAYYSELLRNNSGRKMVDLNPARMGIPERFAEAYCHTLARSHEGGSLAPTSPTHSYRAYNSEDHRPETLRVDGAVSAQGRADLHHVLNDHPLEFAVLYEFLLDGKPDPSQFLRQLDDVTTIVALDKLLPTLTNQDISRLRELQNKVKRQYVQTIIEIFTNHEYAETADAYVEAYAQPGAP